MDDAPEIGPQRKRSIAGRQLHCCCICGKLEPWGNTWSWYGSYKEEEDCVAYPKFCSPACAEKAGKRAENVTKQMKEAAKANEWREPKAVYRKRSYADAAYEQSVQKQPAE